MRFLTAALLCASAFAGNWTRINQISETIVGGVSFPEDGNTGFVVAADASDNKYVFRTDDGGSSWTALNNNGTEMILFDVMMASTTVGVTSGISILSGADMYTSDGFNFIQTPHENEFQEACQSAELFAPPTQNAFGLTGQFGPVNGVQISVDGGQSYKAYDCQAYQNIQARYGAFPSADVWYVAVGTWPESSQTVSSASSNKHFTYRSLSKNVHVPMKANKVAAGPVLRRLTSEDHRVGAPAPPYVGWYAGIQATFDGGNTWSTLFQNETFYFNQISCPTTSTCFVVGENDNSAYCLRTTDSGKTWDTVFSQDNLSLMTVVAITESEIWIGGGNPESFADLGQAFHSTDGGNTWLAQSSLDYLMDLTFPSSTVGYGAALTIAQQGTIVKYTA